MLVPVLLYFCFSSSCPSLSFIVHLSSLEFIWKPSESSVLSFPSLSLIIPLSSTSFMLVNLNSPGSPLSPFYVFSYFVLLSFCHCVFLSSSSFSASLVHLSSSYFIGGCPSSSRVILFLSEHWR